MRIGVVSDTHNYFDPGIPKLLHGVDHILHGGDIGSPASCFNWNKSRRSRPFLATPTTRAITTG